MPKTTASQDLPRVAFVAMVGSKSALKTKVDAQKRAFEALARDDSIGAVLSVDVTPFGDFIDTHTLGESEVSLSRGKPWSEKFDWTIGYSRFLRMVVREVVRDRSDILYIRRPPIDFRLTWALKRLKRRGVKIVLEIPTFPYDGEIAHPLVRNLDRAARKSIPLSVDYIATVSDHDEIFGVPTLRIDNGVDLDAIPAKDRDRDFSAGPLRMLSVSSLEPWHRLDRAIMALRLYWDQGGAGVESLDIVGSGREEAQLRELAGNDPRIRFHGKLFGDSLNAVVAGANIGVGALAEADDRGLTHVAALKHREYAARALPFFYGMPDRGFTESKYALRMPDGPIDVDSIVRWRESIGVDPSDIRQDAARFSWEHQMRLVVDSICPQTS